MSSPWPTVQISAKQAPIAEAETLICASMRRRHKRTRFSTVYGELQGQLYLDGILSAPPSIAPCNTAVFSSSTDYPLENYLLHRLFLEALGMLQGRGTSFIMARSLGINFYTK